jgi:serine phosphatase RsbU (regulator of sigma subunit)
VNSFDQATDASEASRRPRRRTLALSTVIVLLVGILVTAMLSISARVVHSNNEDRLLRQRVREAATVASASIPTLQIPLSSAAILAEATNGNPNAFKKLVEPFNKARAAPFASVSLWSTEPSSNPKPIAVVGEAPELASQTPADVRGYIESSRGKATTALNNLLEARDRRVGYGLTVPGPNAHFLVYAESKFPAGRVARIASNSAFADFDYALFLGTKPTPADLIASSTGGAALSGRTDATTVPFGDSQLLVVLRPRGDLGGSFLANLWWILIVLGLALTAGAATLVERVSRRRVEAEQLAEDNARLYASQRSVALALQHSLLAEDFPTVPGLEIGARYVAGAEGIDIGGDWYDVLGVDANRVLVAVGDVSGRGLHAATTMASLRFAMRAYALDGDGPGAILEKLSRLVSVKRDGQFATALCALIDLRTREMRLASAGHPEPLLVADGDVSFIATKTGLPVGVREDGTYKETVCTLPTGGTLLFYTDGLVERRTEIVDVGLARLADAARGASGSLESMLSTVLASMIPEGSSDDTALLGLRWR